MKELPVFFFLAGVALVTLLPIINPVSTAVFLRSVSSHLSQEERNRQVTRACINMACILVGFLLASHLIMIAFGIVIPCMCFAGGMVIWRFGHLLTACAVSEARREIT